LLTDVGSNVIPEFVKLPAQLACIGGMNVLSLYSLDLRCMILDVVINIGNWCITCQHSQQKEIPVTTASFSL